VNPLLKINLLCELLSAVAIFFLVRLCLERQSHATQSDSFRTPAVRHRASICGLAAASVAWLEPSMILDAHGWPQWDVWILPFYLFAALAALKNRWFWCGCLLALGAMLKGQLLFVAPVFVLWPLWQKRWMSALRALAGFTATAALIVSPWLLRTPGAWIAFAVVAGASLLVALRYKLPHKGAWLAGILGCAAFVIGAFTGGSFAWFEIGFLYGTKHYPYLFISSCYNLASLLAAAGWSLKDNLLSAHVGSVHFHLTLQWALRLFFLGAVALCARGAARHLRNRDPRVLIAITAPWLLMFALLGQMHERYLVWGAVVSAVAPVASARYSRFRLTAIARSRDTSGATTRVTSQSTRMMSPSGLLPLLPLLRRLPEPLAPLTRTPPRNILPIPSDISAIAPTIPASKVMSRTSRLRTWAISCAITP